MLEIIVMKDDASETEGTNCSAFCGWKILLSLCSSDGENEQGGGWSADQVTCFILDGVEQFDYCWNSIHQPDG